MARTTRAAVPDLPALQALTDGQLQQLHTDVWRELERRTPPADGLPIKGLEAGKRVVLIAAAGKHSVLLVGAPESGKSLLRSWLRTLEPAAVSFETWPCPCGYHGSLVRPCTCDVEAIGAYRRTWPVTDMSHELLPERPVTFLGEMRETPLAELQDRLQQLPPVWPTSKLSAEALTFLRAAASELGLTGGAVDRYRRVARTIARLDGAASVSALHLSEAINYRTLTR